MYFRLITIVSSNYLYNLVFWKDAFDHAFAVGILKVKSGLDFSDHIQAEETEANEFVDGKDQHSAYKCKESLPNTKISPNLIQDDPDLSQ